MLSTMKLALRIATANTNFDSQINSYISFVQQDLLSHGMDASNYDDEDPLIIMATELYCKYMFDYDKKGDQYRAQYMALRDNMVLMEKYTNAE